MKIKGFIDHFVFRNAENGYGVADFVVTSAQSGENDNSIMADEVESGETITLVGSLKGCDEGDTIEAEVKMVLHAVYGEQFKVESFRVIPPSDAISIERYLSSGAVKGIGERMAHRIVKKFGDDTFRIMEEEPERLAEIKGISLKKAMEYGLVMQEKKAQREVVIFLQQMGLGGALCARVVKKYGIRTREVIRENPYRLAEEVDGIGFRIADGIAEKLGIRADAEYRVMSGILYALSQGALDGHSYLPEDILRQKTVELLRLGPGEETDELLSTQLGRLTVERKIVVKNQKNGRAVYSSRFYREEQAIAVMLRELSNAKPKDVVVKDCDIERVERELSIELDDRQREAVKTALTEGVFILTGGPGTGKTTTMGAILKLMLNKGISFNLAAPTGRAAKRMTEASGYEAKTIHRLLEVAGEVGGDNAGKTQFGRGPDKPLEADAVVIDEMSMVDMHLFYSLLRACPRGSHLILIGDPAQLPSVGPGEILQDLIDSKSFPVVNLKTIFRQAAKSDIVMNAHRINAGQSLNLSNKSTDFFFLERDRSDVIVKHMVLLMRDKLPSYVKAGTGEIQVLVPMRKGPLGADTLNPALQSVLNPPSAKKEELEQGGRIWRVGDKVMQTKNNYTAAWEVKGKNNITIERGEGIFNGDLGVIKAIDKISQEVEVLFDEGRIVRVPFSDMEEMDHAYAMTIHKSQGSEYPAVLIPLLGGPRMLLNRNLLYTAVTRAKSCVVVLGSRATVEQMIANAGEMSRYTGLVDKIKSLELAEGEG